jgi:hypothetical protein
MLQVIWSNKEIVYNIKYNIENIHIFHYETEMYCKNWINNAIILHGSTTIPIALQEVHISSSAMPYWRYYSKLIIFYLRYHGELLKTWQYFDWLSNFSLGKKLLATPFITDFVWDQIWWNIFR